ncbi:MAG: hypothetical protein AB7N76_16120 [Planctomycetota bacterium]
MAEPAERDYLDAVLRLDPAEETGELFAQRRGHLSPAYPQAYPPPYAHLPQRLECHAALEALRGDLEELDPAAARARAAQVEEACFPDQRAWLSRLVRYGEERARLDRVAPALDPELVAVFRRVLTAPIPEAVGLKETFLQRLWDRPRAAGLRAQVARLRRATPRLAELEPEWLDQVALREGPAFGRKHLAWLLLALLYAALLLLRLATEGS